MDKNTVRSFINGLNPGASLTINFVGDSLSDSRGVQVTNSGTFTFNSKSRGRGKGGSLIMNLTNSAGNTLQISTSHSDSILNMQVSGGELVGYANVSDMPVEYPRDEQRAASFKEAVKSLVGTAGRRVTVNSSLPHLNGSFTVQRATQLRGRNGQIVLTLSSGSETHELWTYRHSGVVTSIVLDS